MSEQRCVPVPRCRVVIGHRAVIAAMVSLVACGGAEDAPGSEAPEKGASAPEQQTALTKLWREGTPAFGVFVPSERERGARGPDGERLPPLYTAEGGARLAADPLLDYVFLNLEGMYDADAVTAIADGMAGSEKTLLVRIPPISTDGADAARARVSEVLAAGATGVVLPHVRSTEEARLAVSFFVDAGADVWSPGNPDGTVLAMLMIEDPGALEQAAEIADVPGYSVLACGIGSLTRALGDREAGEAGNQEVLAQAKRAGLPDMITADADDVVRRVEEGFLGLLMSGPGASEAIEIGRAHAGR
jgi:2-keto-3-deoxy-L-rhamnonate aldolase RhmA